MASLQAGKQVVATAFVVFFTNGPMWILVASFVAFVITTAYHLARWITFRISVDPAELRTSHVFITRTDRRIPIASIHDLHFEQSLLQRLFGVVTVRIETAGGSGSEAELAGLLRWQADALKRAIDEARLGHAVDPAAAPVEPPEVVLVDLTPRELAVAGLSSATIWIVGGALFSTWFFFDELFPGLEERLEPIAESVADFVSRSGALVLAGAAIALALLLVATAAVVSIARTIVRFWGFRVTSNGSRLLRSCGLFTTRRQVLALSRVQRILVRQGLLQKWLDCVSVELGTAAIGSHEQEEKGRTFVIPIVRTAGVQPLLDLIAPGAAALDGSFDPVSPLAGRRYLLRSAVVFAIASCALLPAGHVPALLVWVLFARNLARAPRLARVGGSRATPDLVQFRTGAFARRLVTVPLRRVQGLVLTQNPFDRRLALARLRVYGAGTGNVGSLRDVREPVARELVAAVVASASDASAPLDLEKPNATPRASAVGSEFCPPVES